MFSAFFSHFTAPKTTVTTDQPVQASTDDQTTISTVNNITTKTKRVYGNVFAP